MYVHDIMMNVVKLIKITIKCDINVICHSEETHEKQLWNDEVTRSEARENNYFVLFHFFSTRVEYFVITSKFSATFYTNVHRSRGLLLRPNAMTFLHTLYTYPILI